MASVILASIFMVLISERKLDYVLLISEEFSSNLCLANAFI